MKRQKLSEEKEKVNLFHSDSAAFIPSSKARCDLLCNLFKTHGGSVTNLELAEIVLYDPKCKHSLISEKTKALTQKPKVVSFDWISDCIKNKSRLSIDSYLYKKNAITDFFVSKPANNIPSPVSNSTESVLSSHFEVITSYNFKDCMLLKRGDFVPYSRIASFDVDDTLVQTKSGRRFAKGFDDWKFRYANIVEKLQLAHSHGYGIVLFTNQGGIGAAKEDKREAKVKTVVEKLTSILQALPVPAVCFAATGFSFGRTSNISNCRKPGIGMWNWLVKLNVVPIDKKVSFFVGDAAGRPATNSTKKDHSDSDSKFASNVGEIRFFLPEEFFEKNVFDETIQAQPNDITVLPHSTLEEKITVLPKKARTSPNEMVIFVGYPASGKTTYFKKHFAPLGYVHVNLDTERSHAKCIKLCVDALRSGKNVVIDNTNPSKEARNRYASIALEANIYLRVYHFTIDRALAWKMNKLRSEGERSLVPGPAFANYASQFEVPTEAEGFDSIELIDLTDDLNKCIDLIDLTD